LKQGGYTVTVFSTVPCFVTMFARLAFGLP